MQLSSIEKETHASLFLLPVCSDVSVDDEPPCPEDIDYFTDNGTEDEDDAIDLRPEVTNC